MATTTNFGWETPDDTDLVKDGAAAMRTLGNSIDTSLVDLKGGTTGQVLSKASNTDMDFSWVTSDDANAIQNAIVDAKGDIITATAADTPARLAVGSDGYTLVADSSTSTGLAYSPTFFAGKNKIINGDFGIWQRGTSFSANAYNADRWYTTSDATVTTSQQTFTPATAPVAGYEGTYFLRQAKSAGGTYSQLQQRIEDVRTLAGQTTTLSFWAKADSAITLAPYCTQNFGSGGSAQVDTALSTVAITTSWARYSITFTTPSVSGKTIGTGSYLQFTPTRFASSAAATIDIWGVQVEAGSTATQFQTATGTIQGELAACQRYYFMLASGNNQPIAIASYNSATAIETVLQLPVTMRTAPTISQTTGTNYFSIYRNSADDYFNSLTIDYASTTAVAIYNNTEISGTAGWAGWVRTTNASATLAFNSEL